MVALGEDRFKLMDKSLARVKQRGKISGNGRGQGKTREGPGDP